MFGHIDHVLKGSNDDHASDTGDVQTFMMADERMTCPDVRGDVRVHPSTSFF